MFPPKKEIPIRALNYKTRQGNNILILQFNTYAVQSAANKPIRRFIKQLICCISKYPQRPADNLNKHFLEDYVYGQARLYRSILTGFIFAAPQAGPRDMPPPLDRTSLFA
nr:hypothetical protein [Flavobacterium sp. ASV13]